MATKRPSKKKASGSQRNPGDDPDLGRARPTRVSPWSWYAKGPIRGCFLMRERQWILAWDDSHTIYVLSASGDLIAQRQAPREIVSVAAADTGEAVVAISRTGQVWWLNSNLEPLLEIDVPFNPLAVAVDSHGYYAAVSTQQGKNFAISRAGKKVMEYETNRPLKFLTFVMETGSILGAAEHGLVTCYNFRGHNEWYSALFSNVGSIATDVHGEVVLLACFQHGVVRYTDGVKEGAYRYEHSPCLVAMDYEGTRIFAGALEQYLTELSWEGVVRSHRALGHKPSAMSLDPLGRHIVVAYETGELQLVMLTAANPATAHATADAGNLPTDARRKAKIHVEEDEPARRASSRQPEIPRPGAVAEAAWETRAANNVEEATSTVLLAAPDNKSIALYSTRKNLRIYDNTGQLQHESTGLPGVGRMLAAADTWLAAASDSTLVAYDPQQNESRLCRLALFEISHWHLFPTFGELLTVEACEHVCRCSLPETRVWKKQMEYKVDAAAALPTGEVALTLDDRSMVLLDATGKTMGRYRAKKPEPLQVVGFQNHWITMGSESRTLRGHEIDGSVQWATALPWTPWGALPLGKKLLVTSAEGFALLVDGHGEILTESREPREGAKHFFWYDGSLARIYLVGQTLIVTSFDGRLLWRHTDDHQMGPFAAGSRGVWVFLGRMLTFFPFAKDHRRGSSMVD